MSRMKDLIGNIVSRFSENVDPRINWEFVKYKIRQFTQTYSKETARERRAKQKPGAKTTSERGRKDRTQHWKRSKISDLCI